MQSALIYCRVSTEEQAEDGHHSLSAQKSICKKVAQELGYRILGIYEDPGKSGTKMNRPGLQDLLIRCQEDKRIKGVFVQDTDRLSRNTKDHLTIKALLQKYDVKLISASQPMIEDSPEGNMIDTIIASVNQFQAEITGRKTLKGMQEKARSGWLPGRSPLGYKNIGIGEGEKQRVVQIDETAAPLVKEIFQMYATGRYSTAELADLMYEKGLRTKKGCRLAENKIPEILKNPFYIGILTWGDIKVKGNHPPLIERELFELANYQLRARSTNVYRRRKHDFLLRGLLSCGKCGRRLTAEWHYSKKRAYYRCYKRGGCDRYVETNSLEQQVAERIKGYSFHSKFVQLVFEKLKGMMRRERNEMEIKKQALVNQRTAFEQKRSLAEEKLLVGVLSDDAFVRIKKQLDTDLEHIEREMEQLESRKTINLDTLQEVLALARNLHHTFEIAPFHLKRLYLSFFWERLETLGGKLSNAYPSKIFQALLDTRLAYVHGGDCHPTRFSFAPVMVRTSSEWGGNHPNLRPLLTVLQDKIYMQGLIEKMRLIRQMEASFNLKAAS